MPQQIALIASGAVHDYPLIKSQIEKYDSLIAVDGGLQHCQRMGLVPSLIIGDMDSVTADLLTAYSSVPTQRFNSDKDASDLELALQFALTSNTQRITIFGALELRTDHTLANLHLLRRFPGRVFIESETETIFAIETQATFPCRPGQILSLLPLGGPVSGVTTRGLRWEMDSASLNKSFFSLSNECLDDQVTVHIVTGDLICCLQK